MQPKASEKTEDGLPRLPICIQGDALYAAETIMGICRENKWEYIMTLKESRQRLLSESCEWICEGGSAQEVERDCGKTKRGGNGRA